MKKLNWKNYLIVLLLASLAVGATYKDGIEYLRVIITSPIDAGTGGLEVSVQDQSTDALDLYFIQALGAPTTLTVDAAPEDTIVTVANITNFVDGTYVGIFSPNGDFYFGTQIGAAVGNSISLDTPIDMDFIIGSQVLASTRDMNVDGSVSTQVFQVGPVGVVTALEIDITRIVGYMQDVTAMDDGKFGGCPALSYGIVLRHHNGTIINIWNAKTNGELSILSASDLFYTDRAPSGSYGLRFRNSFAGQEKHGVVIRLAPGEILEILIQDDLTCLNSFLMMAQGHKVSP